MAPVLSLPASPLAVDAPTAVVAPAVVVLGTNDWPVTSTLTLESAKSKVEMRSVTA